MDAGMGIDGLQDQMAEFLKFDLLEHPVPFVTFNRTQEGTYTRSRISYRSLEGDQIPAFLLLPEGPGPYPAVLVHHQHNSERHIGKSEVCGLVGNPLQAFGPALASKGIAVLAPDSICFEDRRKNRGGTPRRTFARILPTTKSRVDLGLRLEEHNPVGRLRPSKIHETMRLQVSLTSPDDVDSEVLMWLQEAYDQNR
jgi:hypothetical protein